MSGSDIVRLTQVLSDDPEGRPIASSDQADEMIHILSEFVVRGDCDLILEKRNGSVTRLKAGQTEPVRTGPVTFWPRTA